MFTIGPRICKRDLSHDDTQYEDGEHSISSKYRTKDAPCMHSVYGTKETYIPDYDKYLEFNQQYKTEQYSMGIKSSEGFYCNSRR